MILSNYYSAEITSKATVPSDGNIMTHFHQLQEANYTLATYDVTRIHLTNSKLYLTRSSSKIGKLLLSILENIVMVPGKKLYEVLISNQKKFFNIATWPAVHSFTWYHKMKVVAHPEIFFKKQVPKCYIGQELVQVSEDFIIFFPPKHSKLMVGLQQLHESGIYQRWDQEEQGLQHSRKVQDRVRVKSPTKILKQVELQIPAQGLIGKVPTMFLIWGECVVLSIFVLFGEILKCIMKCPRT